MDLLPNAVAESLGSGSMRFGFIKRSQPKEVQRTMRTLGFARASLAIAACAATVAYAADTLRSGPQPGDKTTAFQCRDITGPNRGKSLCYV